MPFSDLLILLRGGGDLATGVALRLYRAGFSVMVAELAQPLTVRRGVAFAEAVFAGSVEIEGVTARLADDAMIGMSYTLARTACARSAVQVGEVPVVVDPDGLALRALRPPILIDARMAKSPADTRISQAALVIGLGPGFVAGEHCHAVIETNRGHHLGRVIWEGRAENDTGKPEPVAGFAVERVLRAPTEGVLKSRREIGERLETGDLVATIEGAELRAPFGGILRGLIHDGVRVTAGLKVGDLDPRGIREYCFTVSDKARAVGGGVLEAILAHEPTRELLFNPPDVGRLPDGDLLDKIISA